MGIMQSAITEVNNNTVSQMEIVIDNQEEHEATININNIKEPRGFKDWVKMDIYGIDARREVHDMYMTVKRLELGDWMKNTEWSKIKNSKEEDMISDKLENNNHSGASFSGCMWKTKEVFQNGWYPKYSINQVGTLSHRQYRMANIKKPLSTKPLE